MKATLPRTEFVDALSAATSLTAGRTTKPIYACVKLVAEKGRLEVTATDGEAGLRLHVPANAVGREGQVVVSADRLVNIVREMPDVEVALEVSDRHCMIRGEGSEFRIFTQNASDFPPVAGLDEEPDLVVSGSELRRMISQTLFAAARETSRFAINGVLWEKSGKKLFLVATDGRRLARAGGSIRQSNSADFSAIVPNKALSVFERVFQAPRDGADWNVQIKLLPNQVLMRSDQRVLSSVLLEGHFPDYNQVIPSGTTRKATLNRQEFFSAVRRAALLTSDETRAVKLAFKKDKLELTAQSPEQGDARVQTPIGFSGDALEIGFNPTYISDALKVLSHEELLFELQDSSKPGVLCTEDRNEFLYVVMPVTLSF